MSKTYNIRVGDVMRYNHPGSVYHGAIVRVARVFGSPQLTYSAECARVDGKEWLPIHPHPPMALLTARQLEPLDPGIAILYGADV